MRRIYDKLHSKWPALHLLAVAVVIISFIAGILQIPLFYIVGDIYPAEEKTWFRQAVPLGILYFRGGLFLCWSFLYFVFKLSNEGKEREIQLARAELLMLRALIDSHFLFNSLNTIVSTLERQKQEAKEMVLALSEYLKFSLQHRSDDLVLFSDEIEALDNYLFLERTRLGSALDFAENTDPECLSAKVPGFVLQPLVENAIKYGRESCPSKVFVRLIIRRVAAQLVIQILNTGKWIQPDPYRLSGGVGLEIIRSKLSWLYPGQHSIRTFEKEGWVTVELKMPFVL